MTTSLTDIHRKELTINPTGEQTGVLRSAVHLQISGQKKCRHYVA